ncbi:phage portal protein [Pseudolactococcus yaeyamensis]
MGIKQKIKDMITRGKYAMTQESLNSILDHPKIAVSSKEYGRIKENLKYFESQFSDIEYLNTEGKSKTRALNHLPLARTVSKKIASLVYNEQAEIVIDGEDVNQFVNDVLQNDKFNKNFERYLESCLALGGLAMKPYVDGKQIKVSFIQAPVFFPLQTNMQDVSSAAIVTKTTKVIGSKNVYYTLLEFHEWIDTSYQITNELYKSDIADIVGQRVLLSELYEDLEKLVTVTNLTRPLFTYLKTPGMNNKDINSPLGLSIYDNAKTTIDFINRTYDEFMWDIKMGQRRVIVPEQMTKVEFEGETSRSIFDAEQNVFLQLQLGGMDDFQIKDVTTPIRSDDYIKAINEGLSLFEMQLGVSAGMFTFDGKTMKTATEIVSENSDTYQMRNSIVSLVEHAIKELVVSICELAKAHKIYTGKTPKLDEITVNLDDGVFSDRKTELDYWSQAVAAGLASKLTAIQKTMGLTEKEAEKMLAEINAESVPEISDIDAAMFGASSMVDDDTLSSNSAELKTLNGAQTQSLVAIMGQFSSGALSEGQAVNLIAKAIGIEKEEARKILNGEL